MITLPSLVALSIVLGVVVLCALACLYWHHEPEKAQRAARKVFRFYTRLFGWAATMLLISIMFPLYWLIAVAWLSMKAIACEPGSVKIKLA